MSDGGGLAAAVEAVFEVALVTALPIAALRLERSIVDRVGPADFFEIPLVTGAGRFTGLALAITLVYTRFAEAGLFDFNRLFLPGSPWNVSLPQFLGYRANPFDYGIGTIVDYFERYGGNPTLFALLAAVGVGAVAAIAAPLFFWPRPAARWAVLANLVLTVFDAYLIVYTVALVTWSLYLLNFWTFAVAGVVFQYYRSRARKSSK